MTKRVHNQLTSESINGFVFQAGGEIRLNGDLGAVGAGGPDIGASARSLRALLAEHPGPVPGRRMAELGLDRIAGGGDRAELGELWAELAPSLTELADTMAGLSAMRPHIRAISDGLA